MRKNARMNLARKLQVIEVEVLGSALKLLGGLSGGNRDLRALGEGDLGVVLQEAGADLGALGVE